MLAIRGHRHWLVVIVRAMRVSRIRDQSDIGRPALEVRRRKARDFARRQPVRYRVLDDSYPFLVLLVPKIERTSARAEGSIDGCEFFLPVATVDEVRQLCPELVADVDVESV